MAESAFQKTQIVDSNGDIVDSFSGGGGGGGGGDASATNQLTEIEKLTSIDNKLVTSTSSPTGTENVPIFRTIPSGTQAISGNVGITGSVAVTGTFWQTTQPISAVSLPLPTNAASQSDIQAVRDRLPSTLGAKTGANSLSIVPATDTSFLLGTGNNFIGRTGIRGFRATASFTRPSDTAQYTRNDAITDSTSTPTVRSFDMSTYGAVNAGFYCITNARVISSINQSILPLINVVLFNQSFTATSDNAQLSVDDATAQSGGVIIPCTNTYNLGANSRCVSDPGTWIGQLNTSSTILYFTLQAANDYIPGNAEQFHVVLDGYLL